MENHSTKHSLFTAARPVSEAAAREIGRRQKVTFLVTLFCDQLHEIARKTVGLPELDAADDCLYIRLVRYEWDPANFSLEGQQTPEVAL